jgi:uncharacterized repeat protein (TIGR01451 family)
VKNTATVGASTSDRDPKNDASSVTTTITAPRTSLRVVKTASTKTATPGTRIRYRITLTNTGRGAAAGAVVCDKLPPGLSYVTVAKAKVRGRTACWTVPFLAAKASRTFIVVARVGRTALNGDVANVATVKADNAGTKSAEAGVEVSGAQDRKSGRFTG